MILALLLFLAQDLQSQDLRVTAQLLSPKTSSTMFGKLPREISASSVQACSQSSDATTTPLARIVQQVGIVSGMIVLPRDAALVIVAEAQGKGKWQSAFRWIGAASATVSTLSTLQIIKPNTTIGSWIIFGTAIVAVAAQQASGASQTHSLLAISSESLPDPLQLAPLGCMSGIVLVERTTSSKSLDIMVRRPAVLQK